MASKPLCLFAIAVVVMACGCEFEDDPDVVDKANQYIAQNNPAGCESFTLATSKDSCYKRVAAGLGKPEICANVKDKDAVDGCYHQVAITTNSFTTCTNIKDTQLSALCIAGVGAQTAQNTVNWANSTWNGLKKKVGI
jgi:hypothetical protein